MVGVRLARWMRRWADRLDYRGAPKCTMYSFTFENVEGIRFRTDGRGCRLWYLGDEEYAKAHNEADTEHLIVNWKDMTSRFGR